MPNQIHGKKVQEENKQNGEEMKNKRGLSGVITAVIIIILVLVAIGIVWVVVKKSIIEPSNEIWEADSINLERCLGIKHMNKTLQGNEGLVLTCNETICIWRPIITDICHIYNRK